MHVIIQMNVEDVLNEISQSMRDTLVCHFTGIRQLFKQVVKFIQTKNSMAISGEQGEMVASTLMSKEQLQSGKMKK